jgi:predicted Ser/Thr protein kinase/uncharacterized RDD family membrane protein YckC
MAGKDGKTATKPLALAETAAPAMSVTATASQASDTASDGSPVIRPAPRSFHSPHLPQLATGTELAHFRIDGLLGQGGMGEVYEATDTSLERTVALKVLPVEFADNAQRRKRLMREARAQAKVTHSNVCHIYYVGEQDSRLFFAMERVQGKTFSDLSAEKPVAINDALELVRAAAQGLDAAHQRGFLHRDVKPSNLMLSDDGTVKVLDFGLVAGDDDAVDQSTRTGDSKPRPQVALTQTHAVGTPLYMAPEQARGEPVDLRADIYALGATLYQLISGRPPFEAPTAAILLTLHTEAIRPVLGRTVGPARVTSPIDALIAKMMAPKAEDRFASYGDLIAEIDRVSTKRTRVAGFWVRFTATVIDFFLMLAVFAIPMIIAAQAGVSVSLNDELFIAFAVYKFVTTWRWGCTLGERIMELQVIDIATHKRPRAGQALRRTLILTGPLLLASVLSHVLPLLGSESLANKVSGVLFVVSIGGAMLFLVLAALRNAGKRALWDRFSRTMVKYR